MTTIDDLKDQKARDVYTATGAVLENIIDSMIQGKSNSKVIKIIGSSGSILLESTIQKIK